MLFNFQFLSVFFIVTIARPEPPAGYSFSRPSNSLPPLLPTVSNSYGPPMDSYGPPQPQQLPKESYGPPTQAAIIHKHVYVHVAPPETIEYDAPR